MRIRIAQCLCGPARHAILALAIDAPHITDDIGIEMLKAAVTLILDGKGNEIGVDTPATLMNPWCALCGRLEADWLYEIGWSTEEVADWETAVNMLKEVERANKLAAAFFNLTGQSYDSEQE